MAFKAHSRKFRGQGYALLEMKMVLFELVRRVKWTVDPEYKMKHSAVDGHSSDLLSLLTLRPGKDFSSTEVQSCIQVEAVGV